MLAGDVLGEVALWEEIGVELDTVGVGTGEPERGSGCRVQVGVAERGGVFDRLWCGVPPIGEGKS